jgi:hypothetical protein
MKNDTKSINSLKAKSTQPDKKHNIFRLAVVGILIGTFVAIIFFPKDQGTELNTSHASMGVQSSKTKYLTKKVVVKSDISSQKTELIETEIEQEDPIEAIKNAFGDREELNVLPPPNYHSRPESEWQGMLIDTSLQSVCDGKSSCGLAMACNNNRCGACSVDSDCASGEACVLDHCVIKKNTSCRTASDCGQNEYCVLSGYSADPRGNGSTLAYCQPQVSGSQPTPETTDLVGDDSVPPVFERPVSIDQLQEILLDDFSNTETNEEPNSDQINTEPFDEETAEFEFEKHETLDEIDPENEHEAVPEQTEQLDAKPNQKQ